MLELLSCIVIQPIRNTKTRPHRGSEHAGTSCSPYKRKRWEVDPNSSGFRTLINDDVQPEVLHCRVEVFLNAGVKAVDLINKENVLFLEIGKNAREITRALNLRTASRVHPRTDRVGNDMGQRCFT